jgi:transglutaminase-like putative cysteine protease
MRASLTHVTRYEYDRLVRLGPQTIRLKPLSHCPSPVLFYALTVEPGQHQTRWQNDAHGNEVAVIDFDHKVRGFAATVDLVVDVGDAKASSGHDLPLAIPPDPWFENHRSQYLQTDTSAAVLQAYLADRLLVPIAPINEVKLVAQAVHADVQYITRDEPGVQSALHTLAMRRGSCRDSSWLLVQLLRCRGYAARFVSGYLVDPPSEVLEPGANASPVTELHAWCEVLVEDLGWIGLDPTSGLFTGRGHLPLAAGPDVADAAPVTGALEPCEAQFSFSMSARWL